MEATPVRNRFLIVMVLLGTACHSRVSADLSGRISDSAGVSVSGARVFVEPGLEGPVKEGVVSADGSFLIRGDYYGKTGVFAMAPGYGYGGVHLDIAPGDRSSGLSIVLYGETTISGQVTDEGGTPVSAAHLTGMAITQPVKVGIPLFKLADLGMDMPASDANGHFIIKSIPTGARLMLKFEHSRYAQEAVADVAAGEGDLRVLMYRGVSLSGLVFLRGTESPVSGAVITVRNAQPPHDTAFGVTDGEGVFRLLLKPGVYLLQAHAAGRISAGLQRVELRGEVPDRQVRLELSGKGIVTGTIRDARRDVPVPGARVVLATNGQATGTTRTGEDGRFRLEAPEGFNTLHFEAVDGFQPPDTKVLQITVTAGQELVLPGLWLAPAAEYSLRALETDAKTAVPGAFISLLWPRQFGWQRADRDGRLTPRYSALPDDKRIIGLAEHPDKPLGALFVLNQDTAENAAVVLLPLATVSGHVVNSEGTPLEGVVVGAMFADEASPDALVLWRCITDKAGAYMWPAAPAGVPQRLVATLGKNEAPASRDFNPAPGENLDLGVITLSGSPSPREAPTIWAGMPQLCGPGIRLNTASGLAAFYCLPAEAQVYMNAAASMREQLQPFRMEIAVVVRGPFECDEARVPVFSGDGATTMTHLFNRQGRLQLEIVGLPPIRALQQLAME